MTPEQEEQVRRALAAAARPVDTPDGPPMPPDVVARLEAVLGELVSPAASSGATTGARAAGDELAARRRRRWPNVLVAAAAVSAIAFGAVSVTTGGLGGSDETGNASSAGAGDTTADRGATKAPEAAPSKDVVPDSGQPRSMAPEGPPGPPLRASTLTEDVQSLVDGGPESLARARPLQATCAAPPLKKGEQLLGVRLDGRRASLVLGTPRSGSREARVYLCNDPVAPVATTSVRSTQR